MLEASAGTGKTYTIAALAARLIAEGRAELGQLMLVTFGRMATNELRAPGSRAPRVGRGPAGRRRRTAPPRPGRSAAGRLLSTGEPAELAASPRAGCPGALADFDAATIATTHEFCLQMLDGLGVLGDREPQAAIVEQLTDLTREVATDLYLRRYAAKRQPPMSFDEALEVAEQAVDGGPCPAGAGPGSARTIRRAAAERVGVRDCGAGRGGTAETRGQPVHLRRHADPAPRRASPIPQHGQAAASGSGERYRIVMVDEFQDTDPIQWEILRRAFHGHSTLILIGDPKQAIYAFRGADVFSYLDAVQQADQVRTLGTNSAQRRGPGGRAGRAHG